MFFIYDDDQISSIIDYIYSRSTFEFATNAKHNLLKFFHDNNLYLVKELRYIVNNELLHDILVKQIKQKYVMIDSLNIFIMIDILQLSKFNRELIDTITYVTIDQQSVYNYLIIGLTTLLHFDILFTNYPNNLLNIFC